MLVSGCQSNKPFLPFPCELEAFRRKNYPQQPQFQFPFCGLLLSSPARIPPPLSLYHFFSPPPFPSIHSEMKSSKPEPGELSSLNSSTSSKKDDSLKRDRESQELNDSEDEGDLLEDEDEVRSWEEEREGARTRAKTSMTFADYSVSWISLRIPENIERFPRTCILTNHLHYF